MQEGSSLGFGTGLAILLSFFFSSLILALAQHCLLFLTVFSLRSNKPTISPRLNLCTCSPSEREREKLTVIVGMDLQLHWSMLNRLGLQGYIQKRPQFTIKSNTLTLFQAHSNTCTHSTRCCSFGSEAGMWYGGQTEVFGSCQDSVLGFCCQFKLVCRVLALVCNRVYSAAARGGVIVLDLKQCISVCCQH